MDYCGIILSLIKKYDAGLISFELIDSRLAIIAQDVKKLEKELQIVSLICQEHTASFSVKSHIIAKLLEHGININTRDYRGYTALMHSMMLMIYPGCLELPMFLIEKGADTSITAVDGFTCLHILLDIEKNERFMGKLMDNAYVARIIKHIIEHPDYKPNIQTFSGRTQLMELVANSKFYPIEFVKQLISRGDNPNIPDKSGLTALAFGCEKAGRSASVEAVEILLQNNADPYCHVNMGSLPLLIACCKNRFCKEEINVQEKLKVIQMLLVAMSPFDNDYKKSVLHRTFYYLQMTTMPEVYVVRDPRVAEKAMLLMLDYIDDVNYVIGEFSMLYNECSRIRGVYYELDLSVLKKLIEKGADVNYKEEFIGYSCLHLLTSAVFDNFMYQMKAVDLLLLNGANPDNVNNSGRSSLMCACFASNRYFGHRAALLLLRYGASIDIRDRRGLPALVYALENNNANAARLLIENGATLPQKAINASMARCVMNMADL